MRRIVMAVAVVAGVLGARAADPLMQDAMTDGVVCVEAEHYDTNTAQGMHAWVAVTSRNYSGTVALQALPNLGTNRDTSFTANSPRLDYRIRFNRAGTHYVVVRGVGLTTSDDTIHAGLNGAYVSTADKISGFSSSPKWSRSTLDGPLASINVPSAGDHTLNLWMREDGFVVDKIVVTSNSNFVPVVMGPPESPRGTNAAAEVPERASWITGFRLSNRLMKVDFTPAPGVAAYTVAADADLTSGPGPAAVTNAQGFTATIDPAPLASPTETFAIQPVPVSTNEELTAAVLSRAAYGPTPDLLRRILTGPAPIGPEAYLNEQLAPETIAESADADAVIAALTAQLAAQKATLEDLRAWWVLRAIKADRQLLEVMLQFCDNHFTTYFWKTRDWYRAAGYSEAEAQGLAAWAEYRELEAWRQVLLNPNGTFYDLLRISCESPAMIVYLDTVENTAAVPNENFSREILELFALGVDNGYTQTDIEQMSKCWAGWTVGAALPGAEADPFAPRYTNQVIFVPTNSAQWRWRRGTNEPPAGWQATAFAEGPEWETGTAGFGYGDNDDATILTDMSNKYTTLYLRHAFTVDDPSTCAVLRLKVYVDDGCIVWLNGAEIARTNAGAGARAYNATAPSSIEPFWCWFLFTNGASLLQPGSNLLAVHVLNASKTSSDLSIDTTLFVPGTWRMRFDVGTHNYTNKTIFSNKTVHARFGPPYAGNSYALPVPVRSGTNGLQDGYDIVAHLANVPYAQEFMGQKLIRWFVNENVTFADNHFNVSSLTPEQALLRACMTAWETPGPDGRKGNLRAVLRTIFDSALFRGQRAAAHKVKTPLEFGVGAIRAVRADAGGGAYTAGTDGYDLSTPLRRAGMPVFERSDPDGWPEDGKKWIDTSTDAARMRFAQNLCMATNEPLKTNDYGATGANNVCDPRALIQLRLPSADWTNAAAVTELFLGLFFPGEGAANLEGERQEGLRLLSADDAGTPGASPFGALAPASAVYDQRVRSLAALLMCSPKFQEQ